MTSLVIDRVKSTLSILWFGIFLILNFIYVLSLPSKLIGHIEWTVLDVVVWLWSGALVLSEIHDVVVDFRSIRRYFQGSGNAMDVVYMVVLGTAMLVRMWIHIAQPVAGEPSNDSPLMDVLVGLLCLNLVLCAIRFLLMLASIDRVGVMLIITYEILKKDIAPFGCFAVIAVLCFEAASYFFYWSIDVKFMPGELICFTGNSLSISACTMSYAAFCW